jgi:hypothetical protein
MKYMFNTTDREVRAPREITRRLLTHKHRRPFDAVAYAAALEMLG